MIGPTLMLNGQILYQHEVPHAAFSTPHSAFPSPSLCCQCYMDTIHLIKRLKHWMAMPAASAFFARARKVVISISRMTGMLKLCDAKYERKPSSNLRSTSIVGRMPGRL